MRKIFTVIDYYIPGYKAGGPLRTINNIVDTLGDQFEFWILTRNRDLDGVPYTQVPTGTWVQVGKAWVYYASLRWISLRRIRRLILKIQPDLIYLNSFFSTLSIQVLVLRRLNLIPAIPVILAPRGELSRGALSLKQSKKAAYIQLARRAALYTRLIWQASSALEAKEIHHLWGMDTQIEVVPDLPPYAPSAPPESPVEKVPGQVRLVFLSRISRMKNLLFALRLLREIEAEITLNVYGPIADAAYWELCKSEIKTLPDHVQVNYLGAVSHEEVGHIFASHHAAVFPTLGENFGHAILEALLAGCPVLLSDRTPWQLLESAGAGWVLPLDSKEGWLNALEMCVRMDAKTHARMSACASRFAQEWITSTNAISDMVQLLETKG